MSETIIERSDDSLGMAARRYIARKFGEFERGQIVVTHDALRYILTSFTAEWVQGQKEKKSEGGDKS